MVVTRRGVFALLAYLFILFTRILIRFPVAIEAVDTHRMLLSFF
jgi:hypothetical protein